MGSVQEDSIKKDIPILGDRCAYGLFMFWTQARELFSTNGSMIIIRWLVNDTIYFKK